MALSKRVPTYTDSAADVDVAAGIFAVGQDLGAAEHGHED
jgi:hypothetical protein